MALSFVTYFEIPVLDLDRAIAFYSRLFGITLERAVIDGNAMALFPDAGDGRGITGALARGESYVPSHIASRSHGPPARAQTVSAPRGRGRQR